MARLLGSLGIIFSDDPVQTKSLHPSFSNKISSLGELTPDETAFLLSLDPSEWKKQDHYRVLGLENIRSKSTDDDIKRAYRKKVLQHHPDKKDKTKKSRLPPGVNEHGYFTCITKVRLEGIFSWVVAHN